jgi:hypothetical protein
MPAELSEFFFLLDNEKSSYPRSRPSDLVHATTAQQDIKNSNVSGACKLSVPCQALKLLIFLGTGSLFRIL